MMPVRPSKIIGIGRNYVEHARELGNEMPEVPIVFFKPPSALIGTGDTIHLPDVSSRVEFEAEIGVVIGKRVRHADVAAAERAIGGYVCVNDVTCRDLQKKDGQWGRAKGFDSFCPVGPEGGQRAGLAEPGAGLPRQRSPAPAGPRHRHALFDSGAGLFPERRDDAGARRSHRHRDAGRHRSAPGW